jgi:protein farnesyltransferase/geranylgeranyltransferase type-1 subunit alpha
MAGWVPYRDRDEWRDVVPIPQDDGPNPVVAIQYTDQFRDTMDYFRAVLANNEMSARALSLTEDVIHQNAGNYTVWAFRRAVIDSIGRDWNEELLWVTGLAESNPKNYQIWQHRRSCLEKCCGGEVTGQAEIDFLNEFLTSDEMDDAKNYHAWAHRQWVVSTPSGGELRKGWLGYTHTTSGTLVS